MRRQRRRKLTAGAGLATMLLGALMVLAPGAGAVQQEPVKINADTCPQQGYEPGTEKIEAGDVASVTVTAPEGYLIDGYCVKAGSVHQDDGGPVWIGFDPPVAEATITYPWKGSISHYAVSHVEAGRISVAKDVTGDDQPAAGTTFDFEVECGSADLNGAAEGTKAVFSLADGDAAWVSPYVAEDTLCKVTETDAKGAATTTYSVTGGELLITGGQTSPVVVTNDFPDEGPETGGISVEKTVSGPNQPDDDPAYSFTVSCDGFDLTDGDGTDADFDLKAGQTWSRDGIPVDTVCTVTEDAFAGATTTYSPESGSVTIVADDEESVVVNNHFTGDQPQTGGISVDKVVSGVNTPPSNTEFVFTVDCGEFDLNDADNEGTNAEFSLTADDEPWTFDGIPADTVCTVTEADVPTATTTYSPEGGSVTIVANETASVVVTNSYVGGNEERPDYGVDIVKTNDANEDGTFSDNEEAAVEGQDVEFMITIENTGDAALTISSLVDEFDDEVENLLEDDVDLSCERGNEQAVELGVGTVIPANGEITCTFTLEDYAPAASEFLTNTVTVDTDQTGPESDDSTVTTPEVLSEVEEPEPEPTEEPEEEQEPTVEEKVEDKVEQTTVTTSKPAVKGSVVTRQLPRTGNESHDLAGLGAALIGLGAALVVGSRRRYAASS